MSPGANLRRTLRAVALVSISAVAFLSGCAAEPPVVAAPEPSASASVEPVVVVGTLVFSGSDVRSLDVDDQQIGSVSFADGSTAVVDFVGAALGVDETVVENEQECAGANTQYSWDGITVTQWTDAPGFVVGLSAANADDVRLETTGGFAVGDDVSAFVAAAPAENVARPGGDDVFVAFNVVSAASYDGYTSPVGAVGYVTGGTLQSVATPGEWSSFLC